jgi:hypothetical protein
MGERILSGSAQIYHETGCLVNPIAHCEEKIEDAKQKLFCPLIISSSFFVDGYDCASSSTLKRDILG